MKLFKKRSQVFLNCDDLSIYLFDKVVRTGDVGFLKEGHSENNILDKTEKTYLKDVFEKIMYEYTLLSGTKNLEMKVKSQISIKKLEVTILALESILDIYYKYNMPDILKSVTKIDGVRLDTKLNHKSQAKKLSKKAKLLTNKLNIKIIQFNKKHKKEYVEQEPISETAISVSKILDLKYSISVKETSVSSWVGYLNLCEKQSKNG